MSSISSSSPSSSSGGYMKREDLIGKSVVSKNAEIIGTVRDIAVSMDGKVAVQVQRKQGQDGEDLFIGSDEIAAVGDVILLKSSSDMAGKGVQAAQQPPPTVQPSQPPVLTPPPPYPGLTSSMTASKICQKCGYSNSPNSKFCIKCGTALQ